MLIKDQWIIKSLLKEKPHRDSVPVVGFNAIKPLIQFIQDIDTEYDRISKELNSEKLDFSHLIKRIQSQLQQENNLDEEEVERVISGLVISNTILHGGNQVNSVPDTAAEFNIRTIPEFDNEKLNHYSKRI